MAEPSAAVQKAIYQALTAGSPSPLSCPVYDHVPQDAAFPYVSIDAQQVNEADYLASRMDERFIYLTVWSRYRGQKEVLGILANMDTALHRKRLALDTGTMVICHVARKATMKDADGVTYQGSMTLRILTEH